MSKETLEMLDAFERRRKG